MQEYFKEVYGQVDTPECIISSMFDLLPKELLCNETLKWLDPGCGTGVFSKYILDRLSTTFNKSSDNILKENIYMVEYNIYHLSHLRELFGSNMNFTNQDYLLYEPGFKFDVIIGNPPYNSNHLKVIPQHRPISNTSTFDSKWIPIWHSFLHKSLELLNDGGYLCFIIPTTWMRPDKAEIYNLLTQYKIHKLHTLNSYEVYKIFNKKAQIPCTYFLLEKIPTDGIIPVFDKDVNDYVHFPISTPNTPIPLTHVNILNKITRFTELYGNLGKYLLVTPLPSRKLKFSNDHSDIYKYCNIHTCVIKHGKPEFKYKWSSNPGCFHYKGLPKLILAHSVYGFPYLDRAGTFGVCNRDKFIFMGELGFLQALEQLLSLKSIMVLYSSTQYRMRFLDKSIFILLPDISKLPNFDYSMISDDYIFSYFQFTEHEQSIIKNTVLWKSAS